MYGISSFLAAADGFFEHSNVGIKPMMKITKTTLTNCFIFFTHEALGVQDSTMVEEEFFATEMTSTLEFLQGSC